MDAIERVVATKWRYPENSSSIGFRPEAFEKISEVETGRKR